MTSSAREDHGATVALTPAPGSRRLLLPFAIGASGLTLAILVQLVFDPFRTHIPLCIIHQLTGLDCPGCGAIRSVHALLAGDPLLALRSNALVTLAIPLTAIGLAAWTVRLRRGLRTDLMPSRGVLLVLLGIVLVYTVLRNIPMFWFLAPISYVGG